MKYLVLYQSKYGNTKQYADWITEELNATEMNFKEVSAEDYKNTDVIIFGGGLYAGRMSGLKRFVKQYHLLKEKKVVFFTCGLLDPSDSKMVKHIEKGLNQMMPSDMQKNVKQFHFRAGINYSKLCFLHRAMMMFLRKSILKKDNAERTKEEKFLLETYGETLSFHDRKAISSLIKYVQR